MVAVIVMRKADAGPVSGASAANVREACTKTWQASTEPTILSLEYSTQICRIVKCQTRTYEHTSNYNISTEEEKVPKVQNWLGREDLQLIQTFTKSEKEACKIA